MLSGLKNTMLIFVCPFPVSAKIKDLSKYVLSITNIITVNTHAFNLAQL